MRDIAQEAYDGLDIGGTGWMRPDADLGETVESFQSVAYAAAIMQHDGLIVIRSIHKESMSGRNLVDAIQFTKNR